MLRGIICYLLISIKMYVMFVTSTSNNTIYYYRPLYTIYHIVNIKNSIFHPCHSLPPRLLLTYIFIYLFIHHDHAINAVVLVTICVIRWGWRHYSQFACRHQASEGGTNSEEENAKLKKAANLLQQRKMLQRNLRNLQQHTLSREILASQYLYLNWGGEGCTNTTISFMVLFRCLISFNIIFM